LVHASSVVVFLLLAAFLGFFCGGLLAATAPPDIPRQTRVLPAAALAAIPLHL